MDRRRLGYYILLNILVSAAVTGAILFFYDRAHRSAQVVPVPNPTRPNSVSVTPLAGEVKIDIVSVIGAGTVASEIVVVQNDGSDPLVLTGWYLKSSRGSSYTFPQLTLYPGGTVQVHSTSGGDTAVDLYWGRTSPAWQSGELVSLYDVGGSVRAFYRVP